MFILFKTSVPYRAIHYSFHADSVEVSPPRSFAINRNCSKAASRSSTRSELLAPGTVFVLQHFETVQIEIAVVHGMV